MEVGGDEDFSRRIFIRRTRGNFRRSPPAGQGPDGEDEARSDDGPQKIEPDIAEPGAAIRGENLDALAQEAQGGGGQPPTMSRRISCTTGFPVSSASPCEPRSGTSAKSSPPPPPVTSTSLQCSSRSR